MSVTTRPRASLGRVVEDLGNTLLEVVCGAADSDTEIETVVIHDVLDDGMPLRGAMVLGVGLSEPAEIAALLAALAAQQATALVLRSPVRAEEQVLAASEAAGIPVLALTRGASWAQLVAMLRSLIAEGDVGEQGAQTLGGMPSGDLFALANALATLLNAPVTIEDRNSRVVAFSGRQDEADPARVETVLGRQVPERFTRQLEERGVFRDLYRSEDPIDIAPVDADGVPSFPRVALAVRAGDEILGSIWAAVHEPLTADRVRALKDSAGLVALHMLRQRAGADVERRLRADLLATVLEGGSGSADAASRLRLDGHRCVVLALAAADRTGDESSADARVIAERQHIADAFAMHLVALQLFLSKTKWGLAIRAASYNLRVAGLMGVNVNKLISIVFFVAGLLAAVGGIFLSVRYTLFPQLGAITIKAFIAAVIGGLGSLPGAVVGSLILGLAEMLTTAYISSQYRDLVVFGLLIITLLIRPSGLFGKSVGEKV